MNRHALVLALFLGACAGKEERVESPILWVQAAPEPAPEPPLLDPLVLILPHVEGTSPEMRKQIDDLVDVMFDPFAGRDSLEAKNRLIALGKPAFPRILARMAQVRDTITDVDTVEERMLESSLKLADEALREMDGFLAAHNKSVLRPGSDREYIAYICRLHYMRWTKCLKDMPEVPGPFDASMEYDDLPE